MHKKYKNMKTKNKKKKTRSKNKKTKQTKQNKTKKQKNQSKIAGERHKQNWLKKVGVDSKYKDNIKIPIEFVINGWQLAKMKKSIPDMSLP